MKNRQLEAEGGNKDKQKGKPERHLMLDLGQKTLAMQIGGGKTKKPNWMSTDNEINKPPTAECGFEGQCSRVISN